MKSKPGAKWELLFLLVVSIPILAIAFSTGPDPGHTGAPFPPDSQKTCTECHIGIENSGSGAVTITAPASYASGATVPITVTVSDPNQRRWGFQLSARTAGGQQAGTLVNSNSSTKILSLSGIQYIEHTNAPTTAVGAGFTFTFTWQAPDVSTGPVTFYAAGNAANANFTTSGDRIYTSSRLVQPQAGGPTPSIFDGGVVSGASFAAHPAPVAPGTLIAIFGSDLTENGAIADDTFLGSDGKITATLAGASVKINGTAAPMLRAFPGQLVAQMPTELTGIGTATIEATVGGQTSTSRTFNVDAVAPGIFSIPPSTGGQGAVLLSNTTTIVAPAGSIPGRTTQPANPGDFITIFCTGLGQVTPPVATGQLAPGQHNTVAPTTVTIGGVTTNAAFSGLAPGFAGLYQVDVQVPQGVPSGDAVSLVMTVGGVQSNPVTIAVAAGDSSSNTVPTITALSPSSVDLDVESQTLTISGTGFTPASSVTLNGVAKAPAYVSDTQLTIQVTFSDLTVAGDYPVVVTNLGPEGGSSSSFNLRVRQPAPEDSDDY